MTKPADHEAQDVKGDDAVNGPREVERLRVSRARNDKHAAAQGGQCNVRNDKVDAQVVIKLSNISDDKYTYPQRVQA